MCFIIFTNPCTGAGYDTWSIFKRSLTGLNSEFSFSETSCLAKAEEISLPYYLPIAGGRIIGFIPFPNVKCNQSRSGFELVSPCPFPTTITITPRALPKLWALSCFYSLLSLKILHIYISSSSCPAACTNFPDSLYLSLSFSPSLSLFVSVDHCFREVFQTTFCVRMELL